MENYSHILTQPFYNSIMLNEADWNKANEKAVGLQNKIHVVYESNPTIEISPYQMQDYLQGKLNKKVNINSVRRSISNLKNKELLLILTSTRIGKEGTAEHFYIWKLGNESRKDIKTEKFQGPSIAEYAEKMQPKKQGDLFN